MSVRLEVQPGPAPRKVLMAEQVINEDITSASSSRQIPFSLPEGTSYVHISYLTSGHGLVPQSDSACIGGGDEFCQRQHLLAVDDEQIALVTPWRSDCDELCTVTTFDIPLRGTREGCAENPHGTIASVRAPRANWCPASQTFPIEGDLQLQPGEHTFGIDIADIAEGNAWWPTSLWVYAYGD
jgi:hypothetical protein